MATAPNQRKGLDLMARKYVPVPQFKLASAPILSHLHRAGGVDFLPFPSVNPLNEVAMKAIRNAAHQTFHRLRLDPSLHYYTADRICCDWFGVHPMEVYGPEWFELDDPGCSILYTSPAEKARLYSAGVAA